MSRKQAIGFLVVWILLAIAILFFLAVFIGPLAALGALLLLLLAAGLVLRLNPEPLRLLRKPPKEDPYAAILGGESRGSEELPEKYVPRMILVSAAGEQIVISKPEFTLGRGAECDYTFPPPCAEISRVHMIIRFDPRRQETLIYDNGSQNGTYVNQSRLTPNVPRKLSDGDNVQVGTLRFVAQAAHY